MDTALFARIRSGQFEGWGECLDLFDADSFDYLRQGASQLIGKNALHLEGIIPNEIERLHVRECLEIALLDLVGQASGLAVHTLLGGKKNERIAAMPVIHLGTPDEMAEKAKKWDYHYFKAKLSCQPELDLEIVRAVRQANPDCVLYLDFNCGLADLETAKSIFEQMSCLGVSVIEDPVGDAVELSRYRELREESTGVKLMIDAKARGLNDIRKLIEYEAADVINLHTSVQGGLLRAKERAALAATAGIDCIVGSDGFLGIASSAYQSLASVVLTEGFPCEEVGGAVYHGVEVVKQAYPQEHGMICVPDKPGLGVQVDIEKLNQITTDRVSLQ